MFDTIKKYDIEDVIFINNVKFNVHCCVFNLKELSK